MSFFGDLFTTKSNKSVLGVDIGTSSMKVVQLRREKGKAILETYGELALGPYSGKEIGQATNLSAEEIIESLKDLLREAKVTTKDCGVSIPFSHSLITLVELPYSADSKEQKTIIEFEARKYIPTPIDEVQLDYFIVPKSNLSEHESTESGGQREGVKKIGGEKVNVLLVAVHNNELTLLQQVIVGAELTASFYEIEIFSTIRATVDEPVKPVMVIDVGAASTKTYIVEHGVVMLSHVISAGSQDITQAISISGNIPIARAEALKKEEGLKLSTLATSSIGSQADSVFSRIFSEVRRVLIQYETGHKKSITTIIFTGGGGVTKDLGIYARNIFSIEVRIANPFLKTEAPAFMRKILEEIGPEFSVAVGLALRKLDEG